jgi:CheY-like chemotaxis protein
MRVLFVDDDALMRRLGQFALGDLGGMSVTTASDGEEALAVVEDLAPDVILLDLMMPGHNGDVVLGALQTSRATRDIPVIFLTGIDDAEELAALVTMGAVGCLVKPFDPETLAIKVKSILSETRSLRSSPL